jgi:hypothetical protein
MDNILNFFNQTASPMFILITAGIGGGIFLAFAFIYDRHETKKSHNIKSQSENLNT